MLLGVPEVEHALGTRDIHAAAFLPAGAAIGERDLPRGIVPTDLRRLSTQS